MDFPGSSTKQQWLLSLPERKYLNGDDVKHESKRRRNIENKRLPNLGKRIQHLVDDVALLEKGGYLESQQTPLTASDIRFKPRIRERGRRVFQPCYPPEIQHNEALGLTLGQLARSLSSVTSAIDVNEVIWGFILGYIGETEAKEIYFQLSVDELIGFMEDRKNARTEFTSSNPVSSKRIEQAITISEYPIERKVPSIHRELCQIRSDNYQYDPDQISPNIMETIELSVDETREYLRFIEHLKHFTTGVTDIHWNGVNGEKVFYELWLAPETKSSIEIKNKYNDRNKNNITDKRSVSKILADLAGQDRNQRQSSELQRWSKNPIVQEVGGNKRRGREWDTTIYGDIAGRWAFNDDGPDTISKNIAHIMISGVSRNQLQEKIRETVEQMNECPEKYK